MEYYLGIDPSTLSDDAYAGKFEMLKRIRAMESDQSLEQIMGLFGRPQ